MKKPVGNLPIVLYFIITSVGFASTEDSLSAAFVQCLSQHNIPANESSGIVYSSTAVDYPAILQAYIRNRRFNTSATPKPFLIAVPTTENQVSAAVVCAGNLQILMKIRSGGHDYEGTSYVSNHSFAMLDMSSFRSVDVDAASETAWVGSGALLGELYYSIWRKSETLAFPAGLCPTVAVGGHIGGAGYGNMLRKFGLTVDHVIDARIVVANGSVLDRQSMGEDLFWAIRGGGSASFGVVLLYRIGLVRVPPAVTVFQIEKYRSDNAAEILLEFQQSVTRMDDELFVRVLLQPVTMNQSRTTRLTFIGQYLGPAKNLLDLSARFLPNLGLTNDSCNEMPWIYSVMIWNNLSNPNPKPEKLLDRNPNSASFLKRKSDYVTSQIRVNSLNKILDEMVRIGEVGMVFNSYGGKNSRIPASETPFPYRNGYLFNIQYSVNWDNEADTEELLRQTVQLHQFMTPYVSKKPRSAYFNYKDLDIGAMPDGENSYEKGKIYGEKYFGTNFDKLVGIKTRVDPGNVFRNEQSIPTVGSAPPLSRLPLLALASRSLLSHECFFHFHVVVIMIFLHITGSGPIFFFCFVL